MVDEESHAECRSGISRVTDVAFRYGLGGIRQYFVDVFPVTRSSQTISPGFSRGFGGWAARLNRKVLLTWDDKGCLGPYHSGFEEHFLRARYRMVAWS